MHVIVNMLADKRRVDGVSVLRLIHNTLVLELVCFIGQVLLEILGIALVDLLFLDYSDVVDLLLGHSLTLVHWLNGRVVDVFVDILRYDSLINICLGGGDRLVCYWSLHSLFDFRVFRICRLPNESSCEHYTFL